MAWSWRDRLVREASGSRPPAGVQVDAGSEKLQIVCGAPNARAGLKAPLAKIGAKVGDITIKAAKLRGVESSGMLCSAKELGLDADASGLLELPADAPVGTPLAQYLGLPDASIEIGLTPNRADCLRSRRRARRRRRIRSAVRPLAADAVPPERRRSRSNSTRRPIARATAAASSTASTRPRARPRGSSSACAAAACARSACSST
jgi:tRNA-binding EMAP/Myf-like protein